jgi:ATP10 protein
MNIRVLALAAVFYSCTLSLSAQVGKTFPNLTGETLESKSLTLPAAAKGKTTLIGLAYSKKAEDALRTWYQPLYDKFVLKRGMFDAQLDVNLFFIPMYIGLKQAAYASTMDELKKSNRKDLFPYILFYKGEIEPYEGTLKLEDKNLPYFFLLDETGKIIYSTSGIFTEKKMEALEEHL